jgi:hypothetical protein
MSSHECKQRRQIVKIKLLLFGEAVNIPETSIGLGVGLISVWIDGRGFTSASNDLGTLGYIFLETLHVDIGELDEDRQLLFSNLHGRVVKFDVAPNAFFRNGGLARIAMTIPIQLDGGIVEKKVGFIAEDCTGVSLVSNPLSFSTTMCMMDDRVAEVDTLVSEEERASIVAAAPVPDEGTVPA